MSFSHAVPCFSIGNGFLFYYVKANCSLVICVLQNYTII